MPFVVSKLAGGTRYTTYKTVAGGKQVPVGFIAVRGGAGVTDKRTLISPQGVITPVTAEQAALLKADPVFRLHQKNGMVKILEKDPRDAGKAAVDLDRDKSAQVTRADYLAEGKEPPKAAGDE